MLDKHEEEEGNFPEKLKMVAQEKIDFGNVECGARGRTVFSPLQRLQCGRLMKCCRLGRVGIGE